MLIFYLQCLFAFKFASTSYDEMIPQIVAIVRMFYRKVNSQCMCRLEDRPSKSLNCEASRIK